MGKSSKASFAFITSRNCRPDQFDLPLGHSKPKKIAAALKRCEIKKCSITRCFDFAIAYLTEEEAKINSPPSYALSKT
jgi:hypothetical protein